MHKIINKYKMYLQPLHMFRQINCLPQGGIYQRTTSTYCIQIHNSWFYSRNIYAVHNVDIYRCIKIIKLKIKNNNTYMSSSDYR
jgi:hypothetical protein